MQDCLPALTGRVIPHTEYSRHLRRCLSSRFCHASGLTKEQAQQPDLLQQGIALLVSALESGPRATASIQQRKTADSALQAGSTKAGSAAAGDERVCGTDPSRQHASTAVVQTSAGAICERKDPFCVSMSHALDLADLAEDAALADNAQQVHLAGGLQGNYGLSMSLSDSLDLTAAAEQEIENSMPSKPCRPDSLGMGMGTAPSPSRSEDWDDREIKDRPLSPAGEFYGLSSAHQVGVPSMGLFGRFEQSVASRSPQLAEGFEQRTAGVHSLKKASVSLHELSPFPGDSEQALRRHSDENLAFLEEGSIPRRGQLFATGHSDMQALRCTEQLNKQIIAPGIVDEHLPGCGGLDFANAGQAFGRDAIQDLEDADKLETELHDNWVRDAQGWYELRSSTAMVTRVEDPDPVAAFSGFCDSLAV